MEAYVEIGAYEAKSHFPELLRKARSGMAFRITKRGEHVADLMPPGTSERLGCVQAAKRMQRFVKAHIPLTQLDIKALIEEGRD